MVSIKKKYLSLLVVAGIMAIVVLIASISILFGGRADRKISPNTPLPTPVAYNRNSDGRFRFTPLQKTEINKTTQREVEEKLEVINKTTQDNTTLYTITSTSLGDTDEIRVRDGIVVFENTNIFNKTVGFPPKASIYEKEFGRPEKILEGVSQLGLHISAHIYAAKGFTLFVNRSTGTVYEIHRYIPTTTATYERTYSEYLQPAPDYPKESFQ